MKVRVPIVGTPGKTAQLDADATVGAIFGANLVWPDGTLVTPQQIAAMVAELNGAGAAGELASTIWRLVREVPENVEAVASLESAGIVRRSSDGAWTAAALSSNDLPDLPDAGGGTLRRIQRDAYGRVAGTSDATTTDLPEGDNLYFTEGRARAAGADYFFAVAARFSELPDESAVVEARTNLGLQNIDGGTFN